MGVRIHRLIVHQGKGESCLWTDEEFEPFISSNPDHKIGGNLNQAFFKLCISLVLYI